METMRQQQEAGSQKSEVGQSNGKSRREIGDAVSIDAADAADLRALNTRGQTMRNALADLTLQYELKKAELISSIVSSSKNVETLVHSAASKQGIALDGSTGLWTFDFDTLQFVRTA